jgi:hypothetical protein
MMGLGRLHVEIGSVVFACLSTAEVDWIDLLPPLIDVLVVERNSTKSTRATPYYKEIDRIS